jgi:hypothetical protein
LSAMHWKPPFHGLLGKLRVNDLSHHNSNKCPMPPTKAITIHWLQDHLHGQWWIGRVTLIQYCLKQLMYAILCHCGKFFNDTYCE